MLDHDFGDHKPKMGLFQAPLSLGYTQRDTICMFALFCAFLHFLHFFEGGNAHSPHSLRISTPPPQNWEGQEVISLVCGLKIANKWTKTNNQNKALEGSQNSQKYVLDLKI